MNTPDAKVIRLQEAVSLERLDDLGKVVTKFFILSGTPEEVKERLWNMLADSLTGDMPDGEAARRARLYKELVTLLSAMSNLSNR